MSQWVEEVSFLCIGISALMKGNGSSEGGNFLQTVFGENCRGGQVIAFPRVGSWVQSWTVSPVVFYPYLE